LREIETLVKEAIIYNNKANAILHRILITIDKLLKEKDDELSRTSDLSKS
jgi:hypothetical protein